MESFDELCAGRWREWCDANREDITMVVSGIERDDTGITYTVSVCLRSLAAHAYEVGEDQMGLWQKRVDFGQSPAHRAGGSAFVAAAGEQEAISKTIALLVWS